MRDYLKKHIDPTLKLVLGTTPVVLAMYLLYWLEKNKIWVPETPHRDKITIVVVLVGMAMSFFLMSHFAKGQKK